jgi:hypothetical protein
MVMRVWSSAAQAVAVGPRTPWPARSATAFVSLSILQTIVMPVVSSMVVAATESAPHAAHYGVIANDDALLLDDDIR